MPQSVVASWAKADDFESSRFPFVGVCSSFVWIGFQIRCDFFLKVDTSPGQNITRRELVVLVRECVEPEKSVTYEKHQH